MALRYKLTLPTSYKVLLASKDDQMVDPLSGCFTVFIA